MADSKDKLRPGITETRGAGSSSPVMMWIVIALVVLALIGYAAGYIKVGGKAGPFGFSFGAKG